METRAFRPTPFQVTELSLQQEEAFPGPGLLSGTLARYPVSGPAGHPVGVPEATAASRGVARPWKPRHMDQQGDQAGAHATEDRRGAAVFMAGGRAAQVTENAPPPPHC